MYRTREDEVRAAVSKDEAIRRITQYGGEYDSTHGLDGCFDVWDQLLLCESLAESTPIRSVFSNQTPSQDNNSFGNGSVSDSYKRRENFWLTPEKLEAINKLKQLGYETAPIEIEKLLEIIFEGYNTQSGWWLAVAQQWTPKSINSVFAYMVKAHIERWKTFDNPPAYFTDSIKHHKKRKSVRERRGL